MNRLNGECIPFLIKFDAIKVSSFTSQPKS